MFYSIILENNAGQQIDLSQTANRFMFSKIEGLNPPCRNNQHFLLHWHGKIYYATANISVYAERYVETCEMDNFEQLTSGQISIICPDIYWYSTTPIYAYCSQITSAFHFPFPESDSPFPLGIYSNTDNISIQNDGDEIGFTIQIMASANETVPEIAANARNLAIFQTGKIVGCDDDKQHFGIIESVSLETDAEDGDYLTVTGRFLMSLLSRRIIYLTLYFQNQTAFSTILQTAKSLSRLEIYRITKNAMGT
jgi:hypothetical protein